uniref:Uncharacterized protein n=1 Tax=Strongyloides venezuelensis TaxID=75913 RepID=A0A0K0FDW0_STRVS
MSQLPQTHFKIVIFLLTILSNFVNAWDWGDFHKFAVVFFTILGFGICFLAILIVFYFGFMRGCLKKHQEDVLHTHRAFHPWPPGSAQWERQRTYRASTGRSGGQNDVQYQYGVRENQNTNIPYNTLSNQQYDVKETYHNNQPRRQGEYGQQEYLTTDGQQKSHINAQYYPQEKCYQEQYYPSNIKSSTQFTSQEAYPYTTSHQKSSPYPSANNMQQPPYYPYIHSSYPETDKNVPPQHMRSLSPYYSSIKKETSILKRSFSPPSKNKNMIIRNSTLINQQQSSSIMNTHTYI